MLDLDKFIAEFNIVDNALDMRDLVRWNGRKLRTKENLAEHTHLVVACAIDLIDEIYKDPKAQYLKDSRRISFEKVIRHCMLHDSLELLRGDILSVTKDVIPGLRKFTDDEEVEFRDCLLETCSTIEEELVKLADLKACYKFVERELSYPSNDFAISVYQSTKRKFDEAYLKFKASHNLSITNESLTSNVRFKKGYAADAGTDVILTEDVSIMPMSTMNVNLKINVKPDEGEMAFLCARTSAAAKGLCIAMCPIDANYTGEVTAIVHNISNNIITYRKGEAFCQVVGVPIVQPVNNIEVKKSGKRSDGKLGSTGI